MKTWTYPLIGAVAAVYLAVAGISYVTGGCSGGACSLASNLAYAYGASEAKVTTASNEAAPKSCASKQAKAGCAKSETAKAGCTKAEMKACAGKTMTASACATKCAKGANPVLFTVANPISFAKKA